MVSYKFMVIIDVHKRSLKDAEELMVKRLKNKKITIRKVDYLGKENV